MNKLLVLIVEDDRPVRSLISMALKSRGYQINTAETGNAALLEATSHVPDIMILDLGLPESTSFSPESVWPRVDSSSCGMTASENPLFLQTAG